MSVTAATARRSVLVAAGLAAALAVGAGCSSDSPGKPVPASASGASRPGSAPNLSVPASLPVTLPSSLSASLSIGASSKDPFCKELRNGDLSSIGVQGGTSGLADIVKKWDQLAAAAPSDIKGKVKAVDEYLHSLVSGHPDISHAQQLAQDAADITTWISKHCI